jgi:hypothetical protein
VWLGTLSTVVAVATGMFTLRDQIFPTDAGTASASVTAFETSVGDICAGLNAADHARLGLARTLARRLARAKDIVDERNAILDSWNAVLNSAEYWFGQFNGLDVPTSLAARDRVASASWGRIVTHLRTFTERLDAASDAHSLEVAIKPLPAMQAADEADAVTRSSGLTALGGGQCRLSPSVLVSAVTLPQSKLALRLESVTAAGAPASVRVAKRRPIASTRRPAGATVSAATAAPASQAGAPRGSGTASPSVAASGTSTVPQPSVGPTIAPITASPAPPPGPGGTDSGSSNGSQTGTAGP